MAVIQEAYVKGGSTRKVDDLVRAMSASGVSKSEVSRLVVELDRDLAAFRERRLDQSRYPYLWLDADRTSGATLAARRRGFATEPNPCRSHRVAVRIGGVS